LAVIVVAASADAQMPGAPVLQNAWATPGIVGAVNIAGGSDATVYAAAAAWSPGSGSYQLSGGGGYQTRTGYGSGGVYGFRVAVPFLGGASSAFGLAAFAGAGGGTGATHRTILIPSGAVVLDSSVSTGQFPVGAALGYRRAIGSNHGVSVYATPSYVLFSGGTESDGIFRAAIGADVGITSSIGATAGVEFGQTRPRGFGGPSGTSYGVGVSYALGRR